MNLLQLILIGVSLSMDAFSLSMVYGTKNLKRKIIWLLVIMVGCFHFFMPIFGSMIGSFLIHNIIREPEKLVGVIFIILALEMFFGTKELEDTRGTITSIGEAILFAFSVSLDSFSVGIGLGAEKENIVLAGIIFSLVSAFFTKMGLELGKKLALKFGKIANIIGSILLFLLGIKYFF